MRWWAWLWWRWGRFGAVHVFPLPDVGRAVVVARQRGKFWYPLGWNDAWSVGLTRQGDGWWLEVEYTDGRTADGHVPDDQLEAELRYWLT